MKRLFGLSSHPIRFLPIARSLLFLTIACGANAAAAQSQVSPDNAKPDNVPTVQLKLPPWVRECNLRALARSMTKPTNAPDVSHASAGSASGVRAPQ